MMVSEQRIYRGNPHWNDGLTETRLFNKDRLLFEITKLKARINAVTEDSIKGLDEIAVNVFLFKHTVIRKTCVKFMRRRVIRLELEYNQRFGETY